MPLKIKSNKQIENIQAILAQPFLSANDCSRLIIHLRELSEINAKSNYPMINLYGDLSVHPSLDRKKISSFLKQIEEQFDIPESQQSTNDLIAELFSIQDLQSEILSFRTQIPQIMVFSKKEVWVEFIGAFFSTLLDKPLLQKDSSAQIKNMYFKAVDLDENGSIRFPSNNPLKVIWVIQLRQKDVKIYGKFCFDYKNQIPCPKYS